MKNNIKQFREQFDLTQEDLAKEIGVSRQTIISLEKGRFSPSIILAFKLAQLFNCQIENVFIYEEN
ncbi:helix-turn-helix transcriptional regulator [Lysinibacillus sp. NPDC097214]|uniref:helix-turn-helix transcriptional regulator n=1 Tax=Lysinibacillus sp. NPDC097214 TaxID=3390584 RepID=UPI003D0287DB